MMKARRLRGKRQTYLYLLIGLILAGSTCTPARKTEQVTVAPSIIPSATSLPTPNTINPIVSPATAEWYEQYLDALAGPTPMPRPFAPETKIDDLIRQLGVDDLYAREAAVAALVEIGAPAVPSLAEALRDARTFAADPDYVARTLIAMGTPALQAIRELTAHDEGARSYLVKHLPRMRDADCLGWLINLLADADAKTRRNAVLALGKIGDPRAIAPLGELLQDPDPTMIVEAAAALGKIGDYRAAEPLVKAMKASPTYRQAFESALLAIDDLRATELFLRELQSEQAWVRAVSARWLGEFGGPPATGPLLAALEQEEGNAATPWGAHPIQAEAQALAQIADPASVEPLIAIARSQAKRGGGYDLQKAAIEALGLIGDVRAVGPLVEVATRGVAFVRQEAVEALGRIGDPVAVEPLLAAVASGYGAERTALVEALGNLGDPRAVGTVVQVLREDPRVGTRRVAASTLGEFPTAEAEHALRGAWTDPALSVRLTAAASLLKLGADLQELVPDLISIAAAGEDGYAEYATWLLGQVGTADASQALLTWLQDSDVRASIRSQAAVAVADQGNLQAVEPLIGILYEFPPSDPRALRLMAPEAELRQAAIRSLGKLQSPAAFEPLMAFWEDYLQMPWPNRLEETGAAIALALRQIDPYRFEQIVLDMADSSQDVESLEMILPALEGLDSPQLTTWLLDVARHENEHVRAAALTALSDQADEPTVRTILAEATRYDPSAAIRSQAALSLGRIDHLQAADALRPALWDPDPEVRQAATLSLAPLATADDLSAIQRLLNDPNLGVQRVAIAALSSRLSDAPSVATVLASGLTSPSRKIRLTTASVLGEHLADWPDLHQAFLDVAKDTDQTFILRQRALLSLSTVDSPQVYALLSGSREEPHWRLRQAAALGLGSLQASRSPVDWKQDLLVDMEPFTRDPSWRVREAAFHSLGRFEDLRILDSLAAGLQDPAWQVRQMTTVSLGRFDTPQAVESLSVAMTDDHLYVRHQAVRALAARMQANPQLGDPFATLLQADPSALIRSQAALGLSYAADPAMTQALKSALRDPSPGVRQIATLSLAPLSTADDLPAIQALLDDPNWEVQRAAIAALGSRLTGFPEVVPLLTPYLTDQNVFLRLTSLAALGEHLPDLPDMHQSFFDLARDISLPFSLRQQALLSLSTVDQPAMHVLLADNLKSPDWRLRQTTALGLGHLQSLDFLPNLQSLLEDAYPQVREATAFSLGQFDDPSAVALLASQLDDPAWQVRQQVALSLRNQAHQAMDDLTSLLRDPCWQVRQASLESLASLDAKPAMGNLARIDPQLEVRRVVARIFAGTLDSNVWLPGGAAFESFVEAPSEEEIATQYAYLESSAPAATAARLLDEADQTAREILFGFVTDPIQEMAMAGLPQLGAMSQVADVWGLANDYQQIGDPVDAMDVAFQGAGILAAPLGIVGVPVLQVVLYGFYGQALEGFNQSYVPQTARSDVSPLAPSSSGWGSQSSSPTIPTVDDHVFSLPQNPSQIP